jgi:hypothetical protein
MIQPPPMMQDRMRPDIRMTQINFAGGLTVAAPTDQWIAFLFDVLHPEQQAAIIQRIKDMAEAQQRDRPLVEIPGFFQKEE